MNHVWPASWATDGVHMCWLACHGDSMRDPSLTVISVSRGQCCQQETKASFVDKETRKPTVSRADLIPEHGRGRICNDKFMARGTGRCTQAWEPRIGKAHHGEVLGGQKN
jgi:hypothetical protein